MSDPLKRFYEITESIKGEGSISVKVNSVKSNYIRDTEIMIKMLQKCYGLYSEKKLKKLGDIYKSYAHYCGDNPWSYRGGYDSVLQGMYYNYNKFNEFREYFIQEMNNEIAKLSTKTVYFVLDKSNFYVKIGITKDVKKRLSQLKTNNMSELEILLTIDNVHKSKEKELHDLFAESRVDEKREWFYYSDEIKKYIQEVQNEN